MDGLVKLCWPLMLTLTPTFARADSNSIAPTDAIHYYNWGVYYARQGGLEKALAYFNEAIRLMPQFAIAYHDRGNVHLAKKNYRSAIADYQHMIRLAPQHPWGYFALAHLLASCPKAELRDGRKAMEYAKKGCELAKWQSPGGLDALAVAYAEVGDFQKAVQWQEKALTSAQSYPASEQDKMRARLQLYKQGKAYRMQ
jgi:tetratricopeptide (TPR) repeat protein